MNRKISAVLVLLFSSIGFAQSGWTYDLHPGFPAPFEHLLLPWPTPAVERDMGDCWRGDVTPPFLGTGTVFWCYATPAADVNEVGRSVRNAFRDAGVFTMGEVPATSLTVRENPAVPRNRQTLLDAAGTRLDAWYFEHSDGVFISIAMAPAPTLDGIVEPIPEPEPTTP